MRIMLGDLRRALKETGRDTTKFTFEVYGPNDEPYTVYAIFNPRLPFDVELWKATGPDGEEIDVNELDAMGHDLKARAFDELEKHTNDADPPEIVWNDEF